MLAPDITIRDYTPKTVPAALRIRRTPWGAPTHYTYVYAPGDDADPLLLIVETASHGGMCPGESIQKRIPQAHVDYALRWNGQGENGAVWFEEDCAWAAVAVAAPELFTDLTVLFAKQFAAFLFDKGGR